jgi:hypothetical protein
VRPLSLLLGQGGDEFAAEVGDVGDHAAPDQVRGNREKLEQVFAGLLGWDINRSPSSTGVLMGVVRDPQEDGRWVASTAFGWAHASWDNARPSISRCDPRSRVCGAGGRTLDTRKRVACSEAREEAKAG